MEKEERFKQLEEKYSSIGQDVNSYLEGLLVANPVNYWDYIRVDTLLSLQQPLTDFPDEEIFIMYHQITELYFKLSLHEIHQISNNGKIVLPNGDEKGWNDSLDPDYLITRIKRINRYFDALIKSFEVMVDGMEPEQFLKFRMALLPASGFQSAQYRMIEMGATDFLNIVHKDKRHLFSGTVSDSMIEEMFNHSYWKSGATEAETGKKTLTLKLFEKKYSEKFIDYAKDMKTKNLWQKFKSLSTEDQAREDVINAFKQLDLNVNVNWPLMHYKSAVRYLQKKESDTAATGGTNWQKYLPPRLQLRIFYPELWSDEEKENWGSKMSH